MKKLLTIVGIAGVILTFISTQPAIARTFSGGGGPIFDVFMPNLRFVNDRLKQFTPGYKAFDGPVYNWGGYGFGRVGHNWKIGGYGFGGTSTTSGTFPDGGNRIRQDVSVNISGGGFYTEYRLLNFADDFEVATDLGIGWGGVEVRIDQINQNIRWDDLWHSLNPAAGNDRKTFSINMSRGFFMLQPGVGVKYYINSFMALETRVSYLWAIYTSDWMYQDERILDVPNTDISAPSIGLRLIFGG